MNYPLERITQNNDWIAIVLFLALVILAVVKLLFNYRLQLSLQLLFSKKYVLVFGREKKSIFNWFNILMIFFQLIVFSFLIILTFKEYDKNRNEDNYFLFFGVIIIILFIGYTIKYLLDKFLFKLFENEKLQESITFLKASYLNVGAVLLYPLVMLIIYSPKFNKSILNFTLILAVIMLGFRLYLIIKNNKSLIVRNFFYFILYLCALEIAPLIIILKLTFKDLKAGL